jgi:gluconate 2-dehydrogenase gamma chain
MRRDWGLGTGDWIDPARDDGVTPEQPEHAIVQSGGDPRESSHGGAGDAGGADPGAVAPSPQSPVPSPHVSRRHALKVLGVAPAGALAWMQQQGQQPGQQKPRQPPETPNQPAADTKQPPPAPRKSQFFTARELRTVRVLADDIIPRDERSGSATDAGVPEFIDFNLSVPETTPETRIAWRGGLRWLDTESRKRFGAAYAAATRAQRHQLLDDISWPDKARPEMSAGVAFFARVRDMVAAGFFSSAVGWKDLQYIGNTALPEWTGCPEPALRKLGVSYDLMNTSVKPEDK